TAATTEVDRSAIERGRPANLGLSGPFDSLTGVEPGRSPGKEEQKIMARSIEQIVNQQVLRWLSEQQLADRTPESRVQVSQRPMITISREFGAFAGEMGRIVAEQLGIGFYAQELV